MDVLTVLDSIRDRIEIELKVNVTSAVNKVTPPAVVDESSDDED